MTERFIVAISTSSGVAKVAAVSQSEKHGDFQLLFEFSIVDYKSQSAQLLPSLAQHLSDAGLGAHTCAAIAVDVGPGGFTSLRTACGVAQGLAVAWNVPTIPLTSFECMLPAAYQTEPLTVLIDARLNEIYAATLIRSHQGTQWISPPYLLPIDRLECVEGACVADAHTLALLGEVSNTAVLGEVSAVRLAELAWQEFIAGRTRLPFDCQPMYVRDKVAQTTSERLALKHGAV